MRHWIIRIVTASCILLLLGHMTFFFIRVPNEDFSAQYRIEPMPGYEISRHDSFAVSNLADYKTRLYLLKENENQIPWDALKQLGSFSHFTYVTDWTTGNYGAYYYIFRDCEKMNNMLYIRNHAQSRDDIAQIRQVEDLQDLRTTGNEQSGDFYLNGIRYSYVEGVLQEIGWQHKEHSFELILGHENTVVANYPLSSDTIFAQLLQEKTALSAINSLNNRIDLFLTLYRCNPATIVLQVVLGIAVLIWGILQLIRKPEHAKDYIHRCGYVKIFLAATMLCMALVLFSMPVFLWAYLAAYGLLLALILWMRLSIPSPGENVARRKP